jgi:putative membrane protein
MGRVDFGPLILVATGALLYARAVLVLRGRGWRVGPWQQASFAAGLLATTAGLVGPVDTLSEDLMSAHMAQHLLIADIAAPLMLAGLRTPVLQNMLPPPVLVPLARTRWLRRTVRVLRQPLVAIPIFVISLYGWHFAFAFDAAMRHPGLHAVQHLCFVGGALLVWWPVIEPDRRRLRGELWKAGHVLAARFIGMFLGMAFVLTRHPVYHAVYGERAHEHGLSPVADQQIAGGLMLGLDFFVILFALTFFFWKAAADHDRAEREAARGAPTAAGGR